MSTGTGRAAAARAGAHDRFTERANDAEEVHRAIAEHVAQLSDTEEDSMFSQVRER
ncbi:hypothetical protein [Streptomyces achromogenes]|uniref:hypothetical protein n=1 Tax=Streptomyces achromogenes TaxID=67255 RepID=UPI00369EF211